VEKNQLNFSYRAGRFFVLERLNSWFGEKAGWGVRGLIGRDWWGR
jgi:hypothetical protein